MSTEFKKRGPQRLRPEDGSRVMSIKFRPKEYAKLKSVSLDTDKSIKALIFDAIKIAYGETTDYEMHSIYGIPAMKIKKPMVEAIQTAATWTFTADTITPPAATGIKTSPAKPSVIPQIEPEIPSERAVSDMLWDMLMDE